VAPPRRVIPTLDDPTALEAAYRAATLDQLASRLGVSRSTVRRALIRHRIDRLPRNRNRRPSTARALEDAEWLATQYRTRSAVDIADELHVSSRTVYEAMRRHGIERRTQPGVLQLRRPQLTDPDWLAKAVERGSSTSIATELDVSPGTLIDAYSRAGLEPASTKFFYARGRNRVRPAPETLAATWQAEGTFRGVSRRIGTSPTTAAVWLAEVGIFADDAPKISRAGLKRAIDRRRTLRGIAQDQGVSVATVRVELHRHGLFEAHRLRHRG
jgi:DNA-binding CsgD family transcriptional regulator